jgi:hypothetical protein
MIIKIKPKPKKHDRRLVRKFSFLPVRINDEHYVWLQFYYSVEEYITDTRYFGGGWWRAIDNYFHLYHYNSRSKSK